VTFDALASRVHGALKGRNVRVVWQDGKLYMAKSPSSVQVITSEAPEKAGSFYRASTVDGQVTIQVPHCGSCRARLQASEVGKMSLEAILAFGYDAVVDPEDPSAFNSVSEAVRSLGG
jgi:hypothetical protein